MTQFTQETRAHEWPGYYDRFSYFSPEKVRAGCYPRIMEHLQSTEKAIVLVHGLSDSPYFMSAIGEHFFKNLGYNVYIPLLHCHGLKEPQGMEDVKLEEWKANVRFAIHTAASKSDQISIGGLSTGGTLSFYMAAQPKEKINGALYLFSAALDLGGGPLGFLGELKERLLGTFLVDVLDNNKPLIGDNPYRYGHIDMDGARELAKLIRETDAIIERFSCNKLFSKSVFAAHSASDTTADISGIEKLQKVSALGLFQLYSIPKCFGVSHASLVLKDPIPKSGNPLEKENPQFKEMMEAVTAFEKQWGLYKPQ
ncbi:MAG: alpha/beta hydrolase [Proteobacteria bacterium]|nr:alpha/beta hydrolase [Pseudomonadota bacterium]MBU1060099.1 alpha/beta hydrolase [Pseudomonadota bacterium]